ERDRHGERGRIGASLVDRLLDRRLVAAERMHDAVDDNLRRVDLAVAARLRVGLLTHGMTVQRERVLPAEIIPIVDRQGERENRGVLAQLAEELVRGGTAR